MMRRSGSLAIVGGALLVGISAMLHSSPAAPDTTPPEATAPSEPHRDVPLAASSSERPAIDAVVGLRRQLRAQFGESIAGEHRDVATGDTVVSFVGDVPAEAQRLVDTSDVGGVVLRGGATYTGAELDAMADALLAALASHAPDERHGVGIDDADNGLIVRSPVDRATVRELAARLGIDAPIR